MRMGIFLVVLVVLTAYSLGECEDLESLFVDLRFSEGEMERFQERNDEVAASLPTFADSRLLSERHARCEGNLKREGSSACGLTLTYRTSHPLVEVLAFYESHFASEGWTLQDRNVVRTRYFDKDGVRVQLFVRVPLLTCPDAHIELDAARACEDNWILNEGGEFIIRISPG